MKYNPKIAEAVAALPGFGQLHPHLSSSEAYWPLCQGAFELLYETEKWLAEIAGMKQTCLQPIAGAHGELAGTLLIAASAAIAANSIKTRSSSPIPRTAPTLPAPRLRDSKSLKCHRTKTGEG